MKSSIARATRLTIIVVATVVMVGAGLCSLVGLLVGPTTGPQWLLNLIGWGLSAAMGFLIRALTRPSK